MIFILESNWIKQERPSLKDDLAENLLTRVMKWTPLEASMELLDLQLLAEYKYDKYQQYSTGMRFIENLALWLNQFERQEEKKIAYNFVRNKLIYFSAEEMRSLITRSFSEIIIPYIMQSAGEQVGAKEYQIGKITSSLNYKALIRQSVFLGLSDGAQIDFFRRSNPISNEQVFLTYDLSKKRIDSMLRELQKDLGSILKRELSEDEKKFRMVFLLDDFSASGLSYLRHDTSGINGVDGKIARFLHEIENKKSDMSRLVNLENLRICVVLYLSTEKAIESLNDRISESFPDYSPRPVVRSVYTLGDDIAIKNDENPDLVELLKKYYDSQIETRHYKKGRHKSPYLGYDECGLPLVLPHNTPNNSLPILWFEESRNFRGLFPRISRHVEGPE